MKPNPYEDANGNLVDTPVHPLDRPYLTLADALNLLVLDDPHRAPAINPYGTTDSDNIAAAYRRATEKFFEAARCGEVKLFSYQAGDGYVAVPKDYFETQRTVGDTPCTIETDLGAAPIQIYLAVTREGREQKYQFVTVETASFVDWRTGVLGIVAVKAAGTDLVSPAPDGRGHGVTHSVNKRKRTAIISAIDFFGMKALASLRQKERDALICGAVKKEGLTVTDRCVRGYYLRIRKTGCVPNVPKSVPNVP